MKGLISVFALAVALAFTGPAFAGDVKAAKTAADCQKAGGRWDAATNTCGEKKGYCPIWLFASEGRRLPRSNHPSGQSPSRTGLRTTRSICSRPIGLGSIARSTPRRSSSHGAADSQKSRSRSTFRLLDQGPLVLQALKEKFPCIR